MSDSPVIEPRENGPLVVKRVTRLTGEDGSEMEAKEVFALCRCGLSSSKPFCDGSHNNGFQSANTEEAAGKDKVLTYDGGAARITYNPRLCSHAAECVRLAPAAFDPERRPWIVPDNASDRDLHRVVAACPSGALRMGPAGGNTEHLVESSPGVSIQENGPYWVTDVDLDGAPGGEGGTARKVVLCRCGLSGNKPFCDGSHRDKGWTSA